MSRPKKRVPYKGGEFDATPVTPTSTSEHWNQYLLDDGSVVRTKLVATEFSRIDGEYDTDRNPVYFIKWTTVVAVESPEELRQR